MIPFFVKKNSRTPFWGVVFLYIWDNLINTTTNAVSPD